MKIHKNLKSILLPFIVSMLIIIGFIPQISNSNFGIQVVNAQEDAMRLSHEVPFRIVPIKAKGLVLDAFGDNLPKWKTKVHLYSLAGSANTSEIIGYQQSENNNSFELHMQNDRGLCIGPDVVRPKDIRNGTPMVVKRDCTNTLNHFHEKDQLRVNNSSYCVDINNADFRTLKDVTYHSCNQSNAQRFFLKALDTDEKFAPGSCYRPNNRWFTPKLEKCANKLIPAGYTHIEWTGGAFANLIMKTSTPESTSDSLEYGTGGFSYSKSVEKGVATKYNYHITNQTGRIKLPDDVKTFSIEPWNENATTRYHFIEDAK